MKNLILRQLKNIQYEEIFSRSFFLPIRELQLNLLKQIFTKKLLPLQKDMRQSALFVNADLSTPVIEELNAQGVKLILMRCAGYNNVDLETAHKFRMKVLRVPGYSPEAVAEHAMALALTANRHTHKAYIKCRENNFSLSGTDGT